MANRSSRWTRLLQFCAFSLFAILLVLPARSEETSLDWERARLAGEMERKLTDGLSTFMKKSHFVATVDIKLKEPSKKPLFKEESPGQDIASEGLFPLTKLGVWANPDDLLKEINRQPNGIFGYISGVTVDVILDSTVDPKKDDTIKTVAKKAVSSYGGFPVTVSLNRVDISGSTEAAKRSWQDWLLEMKMPIGLIVATGLLFLLGMMVARQFYGLELRKVAVMESGAQNASAGAGPATSVTRDDDKDKGGSKETVVHGVSGLTGPGTEGIQTQKGFEHFKQLTAKEPHKTAALIRQWINGASREALEVLTVLPRVLPIEMLVPVFSHLDDETRKTWKQLLTDPIREGALLRADAYILTQTVDSLLVPPIPVEDEVKDLVSSLNSEEAAAVSKKNPKVGALLANLLSTIQVARLFTILPKDTVDSIVRESFQFNFSLLPGLSVELKKAVEEIRKSKKVVAVPFMEKSVDLIRELGPDREGEIFNALAESGEFELLEKAAKQFFPAELILSLPVDLLKNGLNQMPVATRTELIVAQEGDRRATLLKAIGETGKLREMIDFQIQQIEKDQVQKRRIEKARGVLWKTFIGNMRDYLRVNEAALDASESVLNGWLDAKRAKGGSSAKAA